MAYGAQAKRIDRNYKSKRPVLLRHDRYTIIPPKQFHFTFVSRLQNLALSAIENLCRANDVFVSKPDIPSQKERLSYQRSVMTDLKVLGYIALLSLEQGCILPKQYEQISRQIAYCQNLLGAWMNSDRRRLSSDGTWSRDSIVWVLLLVVAAVARQQSG